jgi:hypothetical protein
LLGLALLGLALLGLALLGLAWPGLAWLRLACPGLALAWLTLARPAISRRARRRAVCHDSPSRHALCPSRQAAASVTACCRVRHDMLRVLRSMLPCECSPLAGRAPLSPVAPILA